MGIRNRRIISRGLMRNCRLKAREKYRGSVYPVSLATWLTLSAVEVNSSRALFKRIRVRYSTGRMPQRCRNKARRWGAAPHAWFRSRVARMPSHESEYAKCPAWPGNGISTKSLRPRRTSLRVAAPGIYDGQEVVGF